MDKDFNVLEKNIGYSFKNRDILTEALTHRSFLNESSFKRNNERIEFLGDAILEFVVTNYLFNNYIEYNEGDLTSFRAAVVKTESLASEATRLDIGNFILMSKGEEGSGGRLRPYILADTFESLIGAIYIDGGFEESRRFIEDNVCYKISDVISKKSYIDSKSKLQEIAQEAFRITPNYKVLSENGPDHDKVFEMGAYLKDSIISKGEGKSKQEAEQVAASNALNVWEDIKNKFSDIN